MTDLPTPPVDDDDLTDLVAYNSGTLGRETARRLAARLEFDPELRRALEGTELIGRAVWAVAEEAPTMDQLSGPWRFREHAAPRSGAAQVFPPPSTAAPLGPVRADPVRPGRSSVWPARLAAAAAIVAAAAGSVVAYDAFRSDDDGPVADVLGGDPLVVLTMASMTAVEARTANVEVSGTGAVSFDGGVIGRPGERPVVGIELEGEGAVRFPPAGSDAMPDTRLRIAFEGVSGPLIARPPRSVSESIVVDGRRFESTDDGAFAEVDDAQAATVFGVLVLRPDLLGRLPEVADGDVEDLGVEMVDGDVMRHLRFPLERDLLGDEVSQPTVEVWVSSDDETVHRFRIILDGPTEIDGVPDAEMSLDIVFDIVELGEPVDIQIPS